MPVATTRIVPRGQLYSPPDIDAAREFFQRKSRAMTDKLTTVKEAVGRLIHDGDYVASGGFGMVRISTAVLHEIVRQGRKGLGLSGHTSTHDFQILCAGKAFDRCDAAYIIGLERLGLSRQSRRWMESGNVQVTEWSNASLGWRYKAAAMGLPFIPARTMLGTDELKESAAKLIECPFTGKTLVALPALFPDVGFVHVHRADVYGNGQIDGISVADWDMVRACKHLIVTTERIVSTDEIRRNAANTLVPYWLVDAVCHVPYGSYPGNMPFEYFLDADHLNEWLTAEKEEATLTEFMEKYIYGTDTFEDYLELCGGAKRLAELRLLEPLRRPGSA
jgi:glutaconate CoA-transferase subunit A